MPRRRGGPIWRERRSHCVGGRTLFFAVTHPPKIQQARASLVDAVACAGGECVARLSDTAHIHQILIGGPEFEEALGRQRHAVGADEQAGLMGVPDEAESRFLPSEAARGVGRVEDIAPAGGVEQIGMHEGAVARGRHQRERSQPGALRGSQLAGRRLEHPLGARAVALVERLVGAREIVVAEDTGRIQLGDQVEALARLPTVVHRISEDGEALAAGAEGIGKHRFEGGQIGVNVGQESELHEWRGR